MGLMRRLPLILLGLSLVVVPAIGAGGNLQGPSQTIPTRTPTPGPPAPTSPPSTVAPPGGGDATQSAPGTETPSPAPTGPTLTPSATFVPADSLTPTAAPCNDRATLQAQNVTNVRRGPGAAYAIVDEMFYLEVRLITGRAADAAWWQIAIPGGGYGWVADGVVRVQGYTGNVPLAAAPTLAGSSPTPGTPWNPTPRPNCTVTPTPPATVTETPVGAASPEAAANRSTPTMEPTDGSAGDVTQGASATPEPATLEPEPLFPAEGQVEAGAPTMVAVATPVSGEVSAVAGDTGSESQSTPEEETLAMASSRSSIDLLGLAGAGLLAAAAVVAILKRRLP